MAKKTIIEHSASEELKEYMKDSFSIEACKSHMKSFDAEIERLEKTVQTLCSERKTYRDILLLSLLDDAHSKGFFPGVNVRFNRKKTKKSKAITADCKIQCLILCDLNRVNSESMNKLYKLEVFLWPPQVGQFQPPITLDEITLIK